ncbi:MAG TPA: DUF4349 domain-containing protein [Methanospirillum sp.]|uniref:DUF4349 domain-containing protein n=1 Tax=Methanospirillum sp. TaxID=45200 RepID=UPI002D0F5471|nr:DUF4349 domain-containing protein [Methanospirillum sp.]HWQ64993.1 DUF4349 domain-containing protein [Methanospirillum sp.]
MLPQTLLSLLLCLIILVSGCTALDKPVDSITPAAHVSDAYGSAERAAPAPLAEKKATGGTNLAVQSSETLTQSDQKIINTADISLQVSDVRKIADSIKEIVTTSEGVIQSSSVSAGREDKYTGVVTVRVPSSKFDETLKEIQNLGKVTTSSVSAQDVTEEYVDLDAQKNALTNQLTQYNRILGQAVNVSEILEVQREIERIQVELDRITGKMKYLDNRVAFSTITVRLSEPASVVPSPGYSITSVISQAIGGFADTVVWLVIMIMTLLPIIILGAVGVIIYSRWKVRRSD